MNIHAIRETRAAKVHEARTLIEAAGAEKRALNQAEQTAFDKLKADITDLEGQEQRTQFVDDAERRAMGAPAGDKTKLEARTSILEAINSQLEGRAPTGAVAEYSREVEQRTGRRGVFVPLSAFETRAQTTTTAAGIVPTDFRADLFVGPLRNSLVMRSLGARVLTGLRGDVVIPRQKTSMSAAWVAEGESIPESGLTFDNLTLRPRHVGALTELSRQLIQQSSPAIEQLVRDDMSAIMAEEFDRAMLTGDGIKEPLGLLNTAGIQVANLATLDWAAVLAMMLKLDVKNVTPNAWLTSPAAGAKLRGTLKAAAAGAGYLMEGGRLADLPVAVTNQVPLKTTKGQVILGDFSELFVALWSDVQILVNPFADAPYRRGGVLVRAMMTADVAVRRPESFVVASDVVV